MSMSYAAATAAAAGIGDNSDDNDVMPWEKEGWVPITPQGTQKSPNYVRNEIQRYIDASSETQTFIVDNLIGVNYSSFRKFMNPKTYKDQWSAVSNSTYWKAARFLEQNKYEQKSGKTLGSSNKRKSDSIEEHFYVGDEPVQKKTKAEAKQEMEEYMERVMATHIPPHTPTKDHSLVFDGCPEVVKKIKEFLKRDGVTKANFCKYVGNINVSSLNRFVVKKQQDGAAMICYPKAYFFFEKMRVLENEKKSKKRLKNETDHPLGFRLETPREDKWVIIADKWL